MSCTPRHAFCPAYAQQQRYMFTGVPEAQCSSGMKAQVPARRAARLPAAR